MSGKRWSIWRRFKSLDLWKKLGLIFGLCGFLFGVKTCVGDFSPKKVELTDSQMKELLKNSADPSEVSMLLQSIQEERNEAINDSTQVEFIKIISNIYKTISPDSKIVLNQMFVDSISGREFRSDIIIEKNVAGHNVKLLFRLNPYQNPIGKTEIVSFQNQIEKIQASKGIIITKGKYRKEAFEIADRVSIDLATFKYSQSKDWHKKIMIPMTVKVRGPKIKASFEFKSNINGQTQLYIGRISKNSGKTTKNIYELFTEKWNNGSLRDQKDGMLEINDENWQVETNNSWISISKIKFKYQIYEDHKFKYVTPEEFIELKNLSEDKIIYSEYIFKQDLFNDISTWQSVGNISKHLKKVSNQLTITGFKIMNSENIKPKNPKVTKIK